MFHRIKGTDHCPSCCVDCALRPPARCPPSHEPLALANLLPAGTIDLLLSYNDSMLPSECPCDHRHADDGWHILHIQMLLRRLATLEDDSLLRELEFLVRHLFISCTCRLGPLGDILHVRIYVIPYDLANMQGRLRMRDEATVLAPARRYLRKLFQGITQDNSLWQRDNASPGIRKPFICQQTDNRTIAEIYSDLPSPLIPSDDLVSGVARHVLSGEDIGGLRSTLYTYQRRSVAAMIQKEMCHDYIPDPLFVSIAGVDGREFYMQPSTMEILQERPMVQPTQGGVLCEELGTGKTVMILALVLATIDQLPSPEESILDTRPVLTPLAFRAFPSADVIDARKRATRRADHNSMLPSHKVPSLVEILLHRMRVSPETLGVRYYKEELEARSLLHLLQHNTPFYYHHDVEVQNQRSTSRRQKPYPGPRLVYLTTASLIVVPPNLVAQWYSEILKHCRSVLRILVLKNKTELPRAKVLASDYDIVLISHSRFAVEASKCDVTKLHTWKICQCAELCGTRMPDCHCNSPPDVSPLLQIRWKRLVVDEGHVAAAKSTNLTELAKILNVERRWLVTGTPTTNLLGLNFGRNVEPCEAIEELLRIPSSASSDSSPSIPPSNIDDTENHTEAARRWTKADRGDLHKLAVMITHFLKVPHFAANPKVLHHLIMPLLDSEGPRPGSIQVLMQVMNMVMIRHQIEDVEKDVILPVVKQEVVLLDLDPLALMSYNAFQAAIAINAVDSERKDQDYLFHRRNTASLLTAVANLSQIMFWSVSDNLYNVDQMSSNMKANIEAAKKRNVQESDLALLDASYDHISRAVRDNLWRATHAHEDVPYRVHNIPRLLFEAWTRPGLKQSQPNLALSLDDPPHMAFMHPDHLIKIRNMIFDRPLIPLEAMIQTGMNIDVEDLKGVVPDKMEEVRKELSAAQERQKALTDAEDGSATSPESITLPSAPYLSDDDFTKADLLASSPLANVRIGQSASSKLNYILNEVLRYSDQEKFLIFSQSALTLAHVAEGLELINVKALQFTTRVAPHEREQLVMTFETSETYRVLLMELKHGARGLNLIAASRVIFCEPVWQADVESQAIKRAHRIGQTRPISVKTLAIRFTAEEAMINRREVLQRRAVKYRNMTDEEGMRSFIANPAFLERSDLVPTLDFVLLGRQLCKVRGPEIATVSVTHNTVASHVEESLEPPRKKRKGVRFTDLEVEDM